MTTAAPEAATPDAAVEHELFDTSAYELPVPKVDGEKADTIQIRLGGGVDVEISDEAMLAYVDSLKIGSDITIQLEAIVASKQFTVKRDPETGDTTATYKVGLKAHTIYNTDEA